MDLLDFINDYKALFVGKICQVHTAYKAQPSFEVVISATDLHHLFGLHKVTDIYASQTLKLIESGQLSLEHFKSEKNFRDVRQRVNLYPFIKDVFLSETVEYCVIHKDISPNTMKLDVVFFEGNRRTVSVLGLRRAKDGSYRPTTLHQADARKYNRLRKTKIINIIWLD